MRSAFRTCTFIGFLVLTVGAAQAQMPISGNVAGQPGTSNALPRNGRVVSGPVAGLATSASATDVAQPDQWVLVVAGLGAIGWVARRRR